MVPMQKSIRFFMIMLPAFLALVKPVSTIAKPHCIKNTSAAPMRNHMANAASVDREVIMSSVRFSNIKCPPEILVIICILRGGLGRQRKLNKDIFQNNFTFA